MRRVQVWLNQTWSKDFGGEIVRASAFHLGDRGFDSHGGLVTLMWEESVNECRGRSPGTRVSSHRECWQGGLGLPQAYSSTVAVLRDQTWVIGWLPEES
jgi:hypothetical protein